MTPVAASPGLLRVNSSSPAVSTQAQGLSSKPEPGVVTSFASITTQAPSAATSDVNAVVTATATSAMPLALQSASMPASVQLPIPSGPEPTLSDPTTSAAAVTLDGSSSMVHESTSLPAVADATNPSTPAISAATILSPSTVAPITAPIQTEDPVTASTGKERKVASDQSETTVGQKRQIEDVEGQGQEDMPDFKRIATSGPSPLKT